MKIFIANFFYYSSVISELIFAGFLNYSAIIFRKKTIKDVILVYAPYRFKPWILNKIINDLKASSNKSKSYKIFKSLSKLALYKFSNGGYVFLMHQSSIKRCKITGFNLNEISAFYTHSQINQKGIQNIKKLKKIFCLNDYEYSLLNTYGIPTTKLVRFPVGINKNFIINNDKFKNIEKREIDVLLSLRYFIQNSHYKIRKRYEFIIKLVNLLADSGLSVCILGEGWDEIKYLLNKNVQILNLKYNQYPNIYQNTKIYCNPSLTEGGPTSLIEAFTSGCFILTSPIGLSFNLCLDDDSSYLIGFDKDEEDWKNNIIEILDNRSNYEYDKFISERGKKIGDSLFENLSKKLEENIFQKY